MKAEIPPELRKSLAELPPEERRSLLDVWNRLRSDVRVDAPDDHAAWANLQALLAPQERHATPRRSADRRAVPGRVLRRAGVAAALAVVIVSVGLWMWTRPTTVSAPRGEIVSVRLPDGSTAELNSGATIRYQRSGRAVDLEGEAFFDVVADGRPFSVSTPDAVVNVLGTTFNVRAWPGAGTEVALESGRVLVRSTAGHELVLSESGESAGIESGSDSLIVRKGVPRDYVSAWRRRAFAALDRPLASILQDMERRYDLRIDVAGDLEMTASMTLIYGPNTAPESILHDICLARGCRYRPTSRGFALFTNPL